jgi:hypothetical protein
MMARKGLLVIGAAFAALLALVAAVRLSRSESEEIRPPRPVAADPPPPATTPVPPRPSAAADPPPDPRAVSEKAAFQEKHARDLARSLRVALEEKNPEPRPALLRALKSERERGVRAVQAEIAAAAAPGLRADLEAALKELR